MAEVIYPPPPSTLPLTPFPSSPSPFFPTPFPQLFLSLPPYSLLLSLCMCLCYLGYSMDMR